MSELSWHEKQIIKENKSLGLHIYVYNPENKEVCVGLTIGKEYEVLEEMYSDYNNLYYYKIIDDNNEQRTIESSGFMKKVTYSDFDKAILGRFECKRPLYNPIIEDFMNKRVELDRSLARQADEDFVENYVDLDECLNLCGIDTNQTRELKKKLILKKIQEKRKEIEILEDMKEKLPDETFNW